MIRQVSPQFFSLDLAATLAYDRDKLGFDCVGAWHDPPVYAIVVRDGQHIHFHCAPTSCMPNTPAAASSSPGLWATCRGTAASSW